MYPLQIETTRVIVEATELIPDLANLIYDYYEIFPDVKSSFKGFSLNSCWYDIITVDKEFALLPISGCPYKHPLAQGPDDKGTDFNNLYWCIEIPKTIDSCNVDERIKKLVRENTVFVNPFIYPPSNYGFRLTLDKCGRDIFTWMESRGYVEEAKVIKADTTECLLEGGGTYLKYNGDLQHLPQTTGSVTNVYQKEQGRIYCEIQRAARNIWNGLQNLGLTADHVMTLSQYEQIKLMHM